MISRLGVRLGAGLVLLVLVAGVPAMLATLVGWPLPTYLPSWDEVTVVLTSAPTERLLMNTFAAAAWAVWAAFVTSLASEVASLARHGLADRHNQPVGRNPARLLALLLVTAFATGSVAHSAAAGYSQPPAAVELVAVDGPATGDSAGTASTAAAEAEPGPQPAPSRGYLWEDPPPVPGVQEGVGTITVDIAGQRHQVPVATDATYWGLAEQLLGDPRRWPEIRDLNPHPDGEVLVLPHDATSPATPATDGTSDADDPDDPDASLTYEVSSGDWMWHIAGRYLGDETRYPEIAALNPELAAEHPGYPDHIEPGDQLLLPEDADDSGPRRHATGQALEVEVPVSTQSPPPEPAEPAPTPQEEAGQPEPDVWHPPSPQPGTPQATPSTSGPAHTPTVAPEPDSETSGSPQAPNDEQEPPAEVPGWIPVAGGSIGVGLALGLLYAVAMVWRRRRHRYKPTPITSAVLDDPDLAPPLPEHATIRRGLHRQHTTPAPSPTRSMPTVREYTTTEDAPPLPPVGPTGAMLGGDPPLPVELGVGLDGPAALDAARGLLVATLTSGSVEDPDAQGRIIIPAATLATLLGAGAVDLGGMARLRLAPTFAEALSLVEEEIIRRSRVIAEHDVADVAALRAAAVLAEPLPQLVLLTEIPEAGWHTRLATAIHLGAPVEIGVVVIGDWPAGATVTVAADGRTDTNGQRIAVLDTGAAMNALTMLREAHGNTPPPKPAPPPTPSPPGGDNSGVTTTRHSTAAREDFVSNGAKRPPARDITGAATDSVAPAAVQVRVLGVPAVLDADGAPVAGLRGKAAELLVYLALHRTGAQLADIMEAIWPDTPLRRASQRLSTNVANLRTTIRTAARTLDTTTGSGQKLEPVVNTGSRYHLNPSIVDVDWWRVLDAYAGVATADNDDTKLAHLRTAIGLTGGGLAHGRDWEWIDTDREYVRRHLIKIHTQAADLLAATDPHQSRSLYDQACEIDPLSEETARRAMRAAAALGHADAIRHRLARLRHALDAADLDIDPETEHLSTDLLRDLNSH